MNTATFGKLAVLIGTLALVQGEARAGFIHWEVQDGSVDLIGPGWWDLQPGNGLYVDLDGTTGDAGRLFSRDAFLFQSGQTYALQFDLAGNQRGGSTDFVVIQVALGGILNKTYALPGNVPFTTFTEYFSVATTQAAHLSFEGLGGDRVGLLLDDIQLSLGGTVMLQDSFDAENGGRPAGNYGTPYEYDPAIYGDSPPSYPGGPVPSPVPDGGSSLSLALLGVLGLFVVRRGRDLSLATA